MKKPFPFTQQLDAMDCGPACLRMVAKYYGRSYTLQTLRQHSFITREGVSMLGISDAAETIGFRTTGIKISFEQLCKVAEQGTHGELTKMKGIYYDLVKNQLELGA